MLLVQLLASGIQTGLIYALTAAGFALIFGATRIFHVAHGATFALAGYAFLETAQWGLPWPLACLVSLAVAIAFGLFMDSFVYRPILRHESSFFTVFVAAFGMVIVVQSVLEVAFGKSFVSYTSSLTRATPILPGLYIAPVFWVAIVVTLAILALTSVFLGRTRAGIGLRALSESPELLRAFGLSSRKLSALAFTVGSALAVPGAILSAATTGLQPSVGPHVMLISLAATIVGGVGSLRGAVIAGILLGVTESLVVSVVDSAWSEAAGFVLLFGFILFWPSGLLGRATAR